jgi:hypothetical protein
MFGRLEDESRKFPMLVKGPRERRVSAAISFRRCRNVCRYWGAEGAAVQCTQIEASQQVIKLEYIPNAEACRSRRENHNLQPPEPYNNGIGRPLVLLADLGFRHINTGKGQDRQECGGPRRISLSEMNGNSIAVIACHQVVHLTKIRFFAIDWRHERQKSWATRYEAHWL